jgi:hypothetical protein
MLRPHMQAVPGSGASSAATRPYAHQFAAARLLAGGNVTIVDPPTRAPRR